MPLSELFNPSSTCYALSMAPGGFSQFSRSISITYYNTEPSGIIAYVLRSDLDILLYCMFPIWYREIILRPCRRLGNWIFCKKNKKIREDWALEIPSVSDSSIFCFLAYFVFISPTYCISSIMYLLLILNVRWILIYGLSFSFLFCFFGNGWTQVMINQINIFIIFQSGFYFPWK